MCFFLLIQRLTSLKTNTPLSYSEAEALSALNYPCPPGYGVPASWMLSIGGVPVPHVPRGLVR